MNIFISMIIKVPCVVCVCFNETNQPVGIGNLPVGQEKDLESEKETENNQAPRL